MSCGKYNGAGKCLTGGWTSDETQFCTDCPSGRYKSASGLFDDVCNRCQQCPIGSTRTGCGLASEGTCKGWNTPTVTQVRGTGQSGGGTPGNEILDIFGNFYGPERSGPGPAKDIIVRYGSGTNLDSGDPTKVYTALSCRVVTANTWIRCVTAPGYGTGHMLTVTIGDKASGNQRTSAKFAANIRYAAPIVALYSGPGAVDGSTYGNQSLVITGANFGPANPPTPISVAEYGDGNYQLEAKDCHVTVPHTEISCTTSPGAGVGLKVSSNILRTFFFHVSCIPPIACGPHAIFVSM